MSLKVVVIAIEPVTTGATIVVQAAVVASVIESTVVVAAAIEPGVATATIESAVAAISNNRSNSN